MQPTLKDVRQLLAHKGLGWTTRHDPEPGPFLRKFQSGSRAAIVATSTYALTTDGTIAHPSSHSATQPARPDIARPPGETSASVPVLFIRNRCGETAQRWRLALEGFRDRTLVCMFDSEHYHHCEHAFGLPKEKSQRNLGPGLSESQSQSSGHSRRRGPAPRPFSGAFRASEIRQR